MQQNDRMMGNQDTSSLSSWNSSEKRKFDENPVIESQEAFSYGESLESRS